MLELLMHEAQMLKQQDKKIRQIAAVLGKSYRRAAGYLDFFIFDLKSPNLD
jgi:hypothetical protein